MRFHYYTSSGFSCAGECVNACDCYAVCFVVVEGKWWGSVWQDIKNQGDETETKRKKAAQTRERTSWCPSPRGFLVDSVQRHNERKYFRWSSASTALYLSIVGLISASIICIHASALSQKQTVVCNWKAPRIIVNIFWEFWSDAISWEISHETKYALCSFISHARGHKCYVLRIEQLIAVIMVFLCCSMLACKLFRYKSN